MTCPRSNDSPLPLTRLPLLVALAGLALPWNPVWAGPIVTRVADLNPGAAGSFPEQMTVLGDLWFFSAYTPETGRELWRFDGATVTLVKDINDTSVTGAGGVLLGNDSDPSGLTEFNGALYFSAFDPRRGGELWRTDGNSCERVADLNPDADDTLKTSPASSWPQEFAVLGDRLYFSATSGSPASNYELWQYDGTAVGQVANIHPDTGSDHSAYPHALSPLAGTLLFSADDGVNGYELWKHTGDETVLLSNINPGGATSSSFPKYLTAFQEALYFQAYQADTGFELWTTDGGTAVLVDDLVVGSGSAYPDNLVVFDNALCFRARGVDVGYELWRCDGVTVTLAADINPTGDAHPKGLTVFQDRLYFGATDGIHGWELWSYDGTTASMVVDLNPAGDAFPEQLTVVNGVLYFVATTPGDGYEIWRYDGVETTRATNINPGPGDAFPRELAGFGGRLCFSATDDGVSNWELWILTEPGAGVLEVEPAEDLLAAGIAGGPFAPVSMDYTLRNSGGATLEWTAARTVAWLDLSAGEGSLAPGESIVVTVSVNATAGDLAAGEYRDTVSFLNPGPGEVGVVRNIRLTVSPIAISLVYDKASGQAQITVQGAAGREYAIEASDTLRDWTEIAAGAAAADGAFRHEDAVGDSRSYRFYRGRPVR
ncbi:MAG: hypothetical protein H7A46_21900 [Verrucomicrobiales bacterium]|nr:hypothetical protein [Verrucomicrobiales bacterium]